MEPILMRRGQVMEALGVTDKALTKLVRAGVLKSVKVAGLRSYYRRAEVMALTEGGKQCKR